MNILMNVRNGGARNRLQRGSLTLALLALGATGALAQDKIKVGLILPSYDQIRWQNGDQPCFEKEAAKLGMESSTVASQMSETVQASQVENMLTRACTSWLSVRSTRRPARRLCARPTAPASLSSPTTRCR